MRRGQQDSEETQNLLLRARAGEQRAFGELFTRHQGYLQRLVELWLDPRLRPRVDPADVVQEAHLEALHRLESYFEHPALPFRLWLRQIAFDRALKARRYHLKTTRRALGREVALPEESSLMLATHLLSRGPTPSQQLSRHELADRLRQAVGRLTEADREIVMMRHFEGLSNGEASCLLGINPATASRRHGRALLRLHHILFQSGLTESEL